jgi:hypothetical protein
MSLRDKIREAKERQGTAVPAAPEAPAAPPAEGPLASVRGKVLVPTGINRPAADIEREPTSPETPAALEAAERSEPLTPPAPEPAKRGRAVKEAKKAEDVAPPAVPTGFVLCVDCIPGPPPASAEALRVVLLSDLANPLGVAIAAEMKVPHYRLIDYKAGGLLAYALRQRLLADPLPAGTIVVTTRSTFEGRETLSVLEEFASVRIYGVS